MCVDHVQNVHEKLVVSVVVVLKDNTKLNIIQYIMWPDYPNFPAEILVLGNVAKNDEFYQFYTDGFTYIRVNGMFMQQIPNHSTLVPDTWFSKVFLDTRGVKHLLVWYEWNSSVLVKKPMEGSGTLPAS